MTQHSRSLALATTVVGVGVVAFVLGRWSVPETLGPTEVVRAPATASVPHGSATPQAPALVSLDGPGLPAPLEGEVVETGGAVAELDVALNLARQSVAAPDDEHVQEAAEAAAGKLEARVLSDPQALQAALKRFRTVTTKAELEILAAVLGRVRDLQVEELALEAARSDAMSERRVAALHILDALDSPRATPLALDLLARATTPSVRRAAIFAIPEPQGTSAGDAQQVIRSLTHAARSDTDAELRRRAVIQLGSWHHTTADLAPVIHLMATDPSVDVRAGCAFALEVAARREPRVLNALALSMNNRSEDSLVRENAWRALGRLGPLPDALSRDYAAFAQELEHTSGG